MAENKGQDPSNGSVEPSGTVKKKAAMSSNLLNMKFMQRGLDANIATKLKEQIKEVSDQQWHLSVVRESHPISASTTKTQIVYIPSYNHFDIDERRAQKEDTTVNKGRKAFGAFIPDIDDLIKTAKDEPAEDINASDSEHCKPKGDVDKRSKRIRREDKHIEGNRKQRKVKKMKPMDM